MFSPRYTGRADTSEKEQLVERDSSLPLDKPARGDLGEWNQSTATKAAAHGAEGAEAKLGKGANCTLGHAAPRRPQPFHRRSALAVSMLY